MNIRRDPGARDPADAVKDLARDLAEVASHISFFKGEADAYLDDPDYDTLKLRLEMTHAAVGARMNQGR